MRRVRSYRQFSMTETPGLQGDVSGAMTGGALGASHATKSLEALAKAARSSAAQAA